VVKDIDNCPTITNRIRAMPMAIVLVMHVCHRRSSYRRRRISVPIRSSAVEPS
jgi:hypothetical protein